MKTFGMYMAEQNDPRNWSSDTEWTNFFWRTNVLGIVQTIHDNIIDKFLPNILDAYSSNGFYFGKANDFQIMREFFRHNLLLDKFFKISLYSNIYNSDNTSETLNLSLNETSFNLEIINQNFKTESFRIEYFRNEKNRAEEIDLDTWGIKIRKLLQADLPDLLDSKNDENKHRFHNLELSFTGNYKSDPSDWTKIF